MAVHTFWHFGIKSSLDTQNNKTKISLSGYPTSGLKFG